MTHNICCPGFPAQSTDRSGCSAHDEWSEYMVCALILDSAFSQELEEWTQKLSACACSHPCCWAGQLLGYRHIFGFSREALLLSHQTLHSAGRRHSSSCESGRIQHPRDDCKVYFFYIFFQFLKDLYIVLLCFFFESICLMCVSKISQLDSINRDTGYKLAKSINSLCRDYNSYSRNSSKGETFHWGRKKQREYLGSRWHTEKQKRIKQIFSFYCKPHNMELAFRTSWLGSLYSTWLDRQNAVHTNRLPRLFSISISNRIAMVFLDNVDRIMVHFLGDLKHQEWRRRDFNYLWDGQSWLSQLTALGAIARWNGKKWVCHWKLM